MTGVSSISHFIFSGRRNRKQAERILFSVFPRASVRGELTGPFILGTGFAQSEGLQGDPSKDSQTQLACLLSTPCRFFLG